LYICKELVTRQGGQIRARSAPGAGAVFSVTFPVFSLASLIAPVLRTESRMESPVALVITQIGSQTGWLSDAENSHWIRALLQQCLHSDQGVLLPKMGSAGAAELFFILAGTDGIGAEAITRRIRKRLDGYESTEQAGLTVSTSYRSLKGIKRNASESMESFLEKAAATIQGLINEEISSRILANA